MGARSALLFIFILLALDAAVVAGLGRGGLNGGGHGFAATDSAAAPAEVDPDALDTGWSLCQTRFEGKPVTPTSVAVTYLDTGLDDQLVPGDVRAWFGPVDGVQVDVYKLELHGGQRRVAFELSQGKWPTWNQVAAGHSGETVCGLVRAALLRAGIGRPRPAHASPYQAPAFDDGDDDDGGAEDTTMDPESDQSAGMDRSRHDYEFIFARRPRLYRTIEWVGTLDHALDLDTFVALRQWLNRSGP